jgi:hypothetical protein
MRTPCAGATIRARGGSGQRTRAIPGQLWSPCQRLHAITPPFAQCVSGHGTFSPDAAGAGLSRRHGGIDFAIGDLLHRRTGPVIGRDAWHKARSNFGTVR